MKRVCSIIFIWTALLCAQGTVRITTLADVTGASTTVQVISTGSARWVLFIAPSTNSAAIRIGDSNTGASRGAVMAAGGGLFYPPIPPESPSTLHLYNLANIYHYVTTGDKVSISWGN